MNLKRPNVGRTNPLFFVEDSQSCAFAADKVNMKYGLAILAQAASQLLVNDSPEQLVQSLAGQMMVELDCQVFFNYIPSQSHTCLYLNAYAGIPDETAKTIEFLNYGTAVCGTVAQTGERIVKEFIQSLDNPIVALVKSFGVKAYACHPLLSPKGDVLGTLSFGTKTRECFNEDELSLMRTLANQIAVSFQRRQADRELRQLNAELEDRVVHRTRELETINAELQAYANIVAHDFRAPMVNLKGFSGELAHSLSELKQILSRSDITIPIDAQTHVDKLLSREMPESLSFIDTSVNRLERMVKALLKLSQLGRYESSSKEVDVALLIQKIVSANKRAINHSRIRVEIDWLPKIYADAMVLEQVFSNLIDNSIKYLDSNRKSMIRISAIDGVSEHIFYVQDNGCGITIKDKEKIFDIFRRAGRQDIPGEGAGLAYVRTLLRQIGGRIWCESQVGVGTTMKVAIPKYNWSHEC